MYLPTRDECQALTQTSEAFFCMTKNVEGQVVEMYNYRLASHSDFFPEDGKDWTELRGITFVQDSDGSWQRNILLNKFFNINQTIGWMYDDVKDKKIVRVQNKEDGSVISFVKFANGKVRAKSKMSFESEQAEMAQKIYDEDTGLQSMLEDCFNKGLTPIFELCSPDNQIVLEYEYTELILLQVRKDDGHYFNLNDFYTYPTEWEVTFTRDFIVPEFTLDDLLHLKETSQDDIEGWVVTFEDGQMAKIKTDKYLSLHGLIGPDAFRENLLVKTILDGNIDDVIAALVPGTKKDALVTISEKLEQHFNHLVVEFKELRRKYFQDFREVRKDFAIKHSKDRLFGAVMKTLNTSFKDVEKTAETAIKAHLEKQCNGLQDAKAYLKEL